MRVLRFLVQRHPDVLAEFQKLVDNRTLGDGVAFLTYELVRENA